MDMEIIIEIIQNHQEEKINGPRVHKSSRKLCNIFLERMISLKRYLLLNQKITAHNNDNNILQNNETISLQTLSGDKKEQTHFILDPKTPWTFNLSNNTHGPINYDTKAKDINI